MRTFDVSVEIVVAGVECTWCGAVVGEPCHRVRRDGNSWWPDHTHAQRWYDYWNATHDRKERVPVYSAQN